jgi:hypothetical protein
MEQVLVLNGLREVDTRGTASSCAQAPDGSVTCLDTPLGTAAARAAEIGGEQGAYAASRLDALAQTARDESTQATQRADDLAAASESAHRIGDHGSADVAARAAEASRLQARAALAQSAAAAAAAQAVRIGDARRALMAADAVVAAAWRSELAEVNAGALMGLELGVARDALELRQGYPQDVPDVVKYTIADTGTLKGQIIGTKLVLVGVKDGVTSVEVADAAGTRREIKVTVKALIPAEQMALAQETFDKIKALTSSPAALKIDWQDADVLRANYDLIYPVLRRIRNAVTDAPLFRPQEFQSQFLIDVLNTARNNPQAKTLRDVILIKNAKLTSLDVPGAEDFKRRECTRNSVTNVVFHDLYTFTRDYHTAGKITNVILTIADVVGKIYSMVDPATGKIITDSSKAARAVAAPALAEYGADPKKLVSGFGNAVCVAITGGAAALPVAARAALSLRAKAISEARKYRASLLLANDTRRPEERRKESAAAAQSQKIAAQEALARLATLDVPGAFTAAQNVELEEARTIVNADTALEPGRGGAPAGGGGGAIVAVGAAAAAFALWRFLR